MDKCVVIGRSNVQIRRADCLEGTLAFLRRMPCEASDLIDAALEIVPCSARDWPLDVSFNDNVHCFGRPSYAFDVEPDKRRLRLRLAALPQGNDLYWFQRDIFGMLACMAGDLMLHGSAVIGPDAQGWVFCGSSGVGKSTICRILLEEGAQPINDEVNWIFYDDHQELRIVNQPFWFGLSETPTLPVANLYLLQQGSQCSMLPARSRSETFVRLLAAHLSIDTQYDFLRTRAEALKRLVEERTINVLEFNLNGKELCNLLWTSTQPNAC